MTKRVGVALRAAGERPSPVRSGAGRRHPVKAGKPAEPGARTARALTGWSWSGPLVTSRPIKSVPRSLSRMRVERPCKPLLEVVAGSFQNEPKAGSKYVLALRMLIALAFRKKRQQVHSGGWQFYASNLLICFINPQPTCDALAALISCRPHQAPNVYSTLRYFPRPESCIKDQRACGSSAHRSLADASVIGCRPSCVR